MGEPMSSRIVGRWPVFQKGQTGQNCPWGKRHVGRCPDYPESLTSSVRNNYAVKIRRRGDQPSRIRVYLMVTRVPVMGPRGVVRARKALIQELGHQGPVCAHWHVRGPLDGLCGMVLTEKLPYVVAVRFPLRPALAFRPLRVVAGYEPAAHAEMLVTMIHCVSQAFVRHGAALTVVERIPHVIPG